MILISSDTNYQMLCCNARPDAFVNYYKAFFQCYTEKIIFLLETKIFHTYDLVRITCFLLVSGRTCILVRKQNIQTATTFFACTHQTLG